jgi:heat shock protein HslJ
VRLIAPAGKAGAVPLQRNSAVVHDLEWRPWSLVRYAGAGGRLLNVLGGTAITATFAAGQVTGNAGCNDYVAGYLLVGDSLRMTPVASTRAYCADPLGIMQQEAAYFAALQQAAWADVTNDVLSLRAADGATLLEYVPQPQAALEGTTWLAITYNNGQGAVVSVMSGTAITAIFASGFLTGSAGCNNYSAGYALDGNAITIEPPASTMAFCAEPPGVMDQETAYLMALPTAARYRIEGKELTLERADGARVATYASVAPTVTP